MIVWKKIEDEYLVDIYYSLLINDVEIADLWYDYLSNKWFLNPSVFKDLISKKSYREYTTSEEDTKQVKFKALLDLQVDFNKIMYDCNSYGEEISNLVTKCLQEEIYNED